MARFRILIIGNGGREHALAWKLRQSPRVDHIYVAPGNGGTANCGTANGLASVTNVQDPKADDYPALVAFAKKHGVNLVVPGPEAPLVDGIATFFRNAGIPCFGPSKDAARMEGSKAFAKDFMCRHKIPTAAYRSFDNYQAAKEYLDAVQHDVVIKASGLAAGKGVIIPASREEAQSALRHVMLDKEFGAAGDEVVIEEFLNGQELSILSFSDGYTIKSLPPAQDHKRAFDGDQGPNTGGMGCYAPTKVVSPDVLDQIHREILQPTIDGMRKERCPFVGLLFTGLMMTSSGPKVLEYNVRFGDPETQTLLPLLSSDTDLAEILVACTEGWLDAMEVKLQPMFAATVVTAAGGYPGTYNKDTVINLDPLPDSIMVFHAGTAFDGTTLKTSGGRVLAATAIAESLEVAVQKAYAGVQCVHFDKMHYRTDIAHRALGATAVASPEPLTYASAGVSIDAGNMLVERIKTAVRSTKRSGATAEIGGFGGVFDLQNSGYRSSPLLVGAIDGVGTKLAIAQTMGKHDTVGIDLVAMNVNDLVVQGAEPLFFLDCYSCSKLDVDTAATFIQGVANGCRQAGCALIGGETAEMPGLYSGTDYDVVGAAIGAVAGWGRMLPALNPMREGDVLLGLKSDGLHSNGFSFVRKIVQHSGLSYGAPAPWDDTTTVGLSLLTPTRIYVQSCLAVARKGLVLGMAHITGGGLTENVPRMLPRHLAAEIDVARWQLPPVFAWLKTAAGRISAAEFARTFNVGVGMVLVVPAKHVQVAVAELEGAGETVFHIGSLVRRKQSGCLLKNTDSWP